MRRSIGKPVSAWAFVLLAIFALWLPVAPARGQASDVLPADIEDIGIEPNIQAQLPLDATFRNEAGETVRLGDYFDGERPVVILPVYYSCPMLCGVTLNSLIDTAKEMRWTPGDEYRIVVFSFDPRESPRLAKLNKENTLKEFGRDVPDDGWVFLTGDEPQIQRLTEALGFKYAWSERRQEYIHAAALMICTPGGRISQYMYGVMYDPSTMRLLLVEAAEGKVGSPLDQFLLYCFEFDPEEGSYAWRAIRLMRLGGTLTIIAMILTIGPLWIRGQIRQRRQQAQQEPAATDKPDTDSTS